MIIQKKDKVFQTRTANEIIPEKYSFFNTKRIEERVSLKDRDNENTRRIATLEIQEEAFVDLRRMRRMKGDYAINLLINRMPKGVRLDINAIVLTTGNKKNIVLDTSKEKIPFSTFFAKNNNCSERVVQNAIKEFVDEGALYKLNKYQYMLNPYYITHPSISLSKIAELQAYWDRIMNGEKITTPIEWIKSEKLGNSFETKNDLTAMLENVEEGDRNTLELKRLRKQHMQEDIKAIEDNIEDWKILLIQFLTKNYPDVPENIPSAILQHFKRYILKGQTDGYITDMPILHLDGTIKPLRLIAEVCI